MNTVPVVQVFGFAVSFPPTMKTPEIDGEAVVATRAVEEDIAADVVNPVCLPVTLTLICLSRCDEPSVKVGYVAPLIATPFAYHW